MRAHGTFLVVLLLSLPAHAAERCKKKIVKNEFHGKAAVVCTNEAGRVTYSADYKKGQRHGVVKRWFDNGRLSSIEHYSEGQRDGKCEYYSEKHFTLSSVKHYKLEKRHGLWQEYWEEGRDGKLRSEEHYKDDKPHGTHKDFHPNGRLKMLSTFSEGKLDGPRTYHREDGGLQEEQYFKNGKTHGAQKRYWPNGKLQHLRTYDASVLNNYGDSAQHGLDAWYHENGTLRSERCYQRGEQVEGLAPCKGGAAAQAGAAETVKEHYESGQLKVEYEVKAGKKHGRYVEYRHDGKLLERTRYVDGKRDGKYETFFKNGKPAELGTFSAGKRSGKWLERHESTGTVARELRYGEGEKLEEEHLFYQNGKRKQSQILRGDRVEEKRFHDNGKLEFEGSYLAAWGKHLVSSRGGYYHRRYDGLTKHYREDGTLSSTTEYKSGVQDGNEDHFGENGKLRLRETYQKGRRVALKEYDQNGKLTKSEEYNEDGSRK